MQHTCIWMFGWFYRIWRWRNCSAPESLWDNTRKKWSGPPKCWEPVASYEEWDLQTVSWSMELLWLGNAEFHHTLGLFFKFLQTHDLVQAIEPPMGLGLHSTLFFFFYFQRRELWNKAKTHPLDWGTINKYLRGGDHEDILDVIDLLLTIFPTSTDAERGFSALKHIKTDPRNLLKGTTLNKLMGVKLLMEDIGKWDCRHAWWVLLTCGVPFAE